ncbi:MAG: hypothetical protein Pg6C_18030 [Treponemataceae bacterium]|nr:MAG: hypothetical protein Pg6C_18030 [Treponemataceae bacterium]
MKTDGSDQNTKGQQNGNGQPVSNEEQARRTLQSQITGMAKEFERALPGKIGVERMMRIVMTAILKTPQLAMCEPTTFFGALLQALQLGLEVNTPLGQAYLIPRRKNDRNGKLLYWECNFQLGYQGLLELCYRSKQYEFISARIVYDGDEFDYQYGSRQYLRHVPRYASDKPLFAYGYYKLREGGEDFAVWKYEDVLKHGEEFSDSFNKEKPWASPWSKNDTFQEGMVLKTMLKTVLKFAPKSVELAEASTADDRVLVAEKYEDAGNVKLRFDVKQIEAPNQEDREFMDKVNGMGNEPEKETVPAGKAETARQERRAGESLPVTPSGATAGNGGNNSGLFAGDETAALEEQYEREQDARYEGPDFGN